MKKGFYSSVCWSVSVGVKGFSLIELLFALSILSVTLAIALPSFSFLLAKVRIDSDISSVRTGLSTARMTSLSKKKQVIVCRWDGVAGCTGNAGIGTVVWEKGLFIYFDLDGNKSWSPLNDRALKILPFSLSNTITWNNGEKVIFQRDGSSPGYNGSFVFTDSTGLVGEKLILSQTGRLRNTSNN